jgi:predicted Zn-dependent peptidase
VIAATAAGLTQVELDRARAQMKAGLVMGLESASARAERLARSLMIWGCEPDLAHTVSKIEAVTMEDARAAAARLLSGRPTLTYYGPEEGVAGLDRASAKLAA